MPNFIFQAATNIFYFFSVSKQLIWSIRFHNLSYTETHRWPCCDLAPAWNRESSRAADVDDKSSRTWVESRCSIVSKKKNFLHLKKEKREQALLNGASHVHCICNLQCHEISNLCSGWRPSNQRLFQFPLISLVWLGGSDDMQFWLLAHFASHGVTRR